MNTHQIKKSMALGLLLLMAAVTATAQNIWKTDAANVKAGQDYTLSLVLENTDSITALQFDLAFPSGTILKEGVSATLNEERIEGHSLSMEKIAGTNLYRFLVHNASNKVLKKNGGTLISLPVSIGNNFKSGVIAMSNVVMTNKKAVQLAYSTQFGYLSVQQKQKVTLTVSGLEQVVSENKAAEVTISMIPEWVKEKIVCNYYKDVACKEVADAASRQKAGAFYMTFAFAGNDTLQTLNDTLIMVLNNKQKVDLTIAGTILPEATTILQGQSLSASILSGGKVQTSEGKPLPGTFAWTNGNQQVTATGLYSITFSPEDYANYATKDTLIKLEVTPVYQVFIGQPENGAISVTGLKSDNQYAAGQILGLKAIPAANYKFVSWSVGGTNAETTWTVNKAATISAVFAPITYTVSVTQPVGGTLSVKAGDRNVSSGEALIQGTELSIMATPETGKKLESLTIDKVGYSSGKYVLNKNVTLAATFKDVQNEYPVNTTATLNGTLRLYQEDGTAIPAGTALAEGKTFKVIPLANAGYELSALWINGVNQTIPATDNVYTGKMTKGDATVSATFIPINYTLTLSAATGGSFKVMCDGTVLNNNASITYNSVLTIEDFVVTDGYKFVGMVANGRKIDPLSGSSLTVNGDLKITTDFEKLTPIKDEYIISTPQTYTYNGQSKSFIIHTTQTHANDFTLTYKNEEGTDIAGIPVKGGTYNVKITRPADDIYAAYSSTDKVFAEKLKIAKSKIAVTVAPTANETGKKGKTTLYQDEQNVTVDETTPGMYIFRYDVADVDKVNYIGTEYYLPTTTETVKLNTGNMLRSITTEPKGYVRITNGGLPYEAGADIRIGTPLTIEAVPNEGYKFAGWQGRTETDKVITVTVAADMDLNFIPNFGDKKELTPALANASDVYSGSLKEVRLSSTIDNAQISVYLDEKCTQPADLKNAGNYFIRVYRPATDEYKEVNAVLPYTITKATPAIEKPTVSVATEGQPLSEILLLGGNAGNVPGTFAWTTPAEMVKKGDNEYSVVFTSADPNYVNVVVKVTVTGLSATKSEGGGTDPEPPVDPADPEKPVDPEKPTSIEQIATETLIVVRDLTLEIHPQTPVDIAVVTMEGKYIYQGKVDEAKNIQVPQTGIYIVSFVHDSMQTSRKINVQ